MMCYDLRALTSTGAIAGDERRKGNIKVPEHAAHAGDEDAVGEHVGRVLAQKLLGASVGSYCQNRRALILRIPCNAQSLNGIPSPVTAIILNSLSGAQCSPQASHIMPL